MKHFNFLTDFVNLNKWLNKVEVVEVEVILSLTFASQDALDYSEELDDRGGHNFRA